jgi:hypothetical protein
MNSSIPRSYSDKYIPGMSDFDLFRNKNQDWTSAPFVKATYLLLILLSYLLMHVSRMITEEDIWTIINVGHGVITFMIFHWVKGCPDESTQGDYSGDTLYEQIDAGIPYTASKKFLMLVPTLITWMACFMASFKMIYVVVNFGIWLICIIAKLPQLHHVRILGINSTLGIDKKFEVHTPTATSPRSPSRKSDRIANKKKN